LIAAEPLRTRTAAAPDRGDLNTAERLTVVVHHAPGNRRRHLEPDLDVRDDLAVSDLDPPRRLRGRCPERGPQIPGRGGCGPRREDEGTRRQSVERKPPERVSRRRQAQRRL